MQSGESQGWLAWGSILAALGASLCCILPLAVALLGVGSAALGTQLEPFRPYLAGLTAVLLGLAFYRAYKPRGSECETDESCAVPASLRRQRIALWVIAALALLLVAFPFYVGWLY